MVWSNLVYDGFMFPFERALLASLRRRLLAGASGDVLEIGAGTGVNLQYLPGYQLRSYSCLDREWTGLSASQVLPALPDLPFRGAVQGDVERLPFANERFDTIISTLLFCTVIHPKDGLLEVHRVLRPDGRLLFIEHVLPEERHLAALFDWLTPLWRRMASGCHLNRRTVEMIEDAGFSLSPESLYTGRIFVAGQATKI